ncbi:MAG: SDR family NAD(P)-dependent oxidoreductase [Mycobacterium sp.]
MRLAGMRPIPRWPVRPSVDLQGKRILLTGGSSGIGAVAAEKLAAEGASVILVARRERLLGEVVERIIASGGNAVATPANLADVDQVDELVKSVGVVDILINNAARSIRRPLAGSLERWHDIERVMQLKYFVYYPLVATAMIAPTRAYDGVPALTLDEAADWMVTAARTRPIRIAPRKALALRALDVVAPRTLNNILARETSRMNANAGRSVVTEYQPGPGIPLARPS